MQDKSNASGSIHKLHAENEDDRHNPMNDEGISPFASIDIKPDLEPHLPKLNFNLKAKDKIPSTKPVITPRRNEITQQHFEAVKTSMDLIKQLQEKNKSSSQKEFLS